MLTLMRPDIERRIPHAGAMCLLDAVCHWDSERIVCEAWPRATGHPLSRRGRVPAIVAPEYAAQATAVHGALLDACCCPRAGRLAKLSQVELLSPDLPVSASPLRVQANLLGREASGCLYTFEVEGGSQTIARGRLIVAFMGREIS
jgi:predicted hotdog family 3-hydroxylacyl-ACP dehydratase